ncbi:hypothetical protein Q31b_27150 [Novipirellula aureliae]|uniref:PEP-CTERM protein-sorting domain-containing protein n=1 Tax=Novipirellula aureliae TaxID=2527966 RepID=A0A5C6E1M5_9BACT|nr:hypothetical protein [Novipirellula aureliae]TWU41276.1 hypothetical protein Q31b_27150 [Novipirellula aureliae]
MKFLILTCSMIVALFVIKDANAEAVLTLSDIQITEGTTSADVIVFADGGDQVTSFATFIAVGNDPMEAFAGNVPAFITNVNNTLGVFGQSPAFDPFLGDGAGLGAGPTAGLVGADWTLFATNENFVTLDGSELFRFTVDTSGLTAGQSIDLTLNTDSLTGQNPIFGYFGGGSQLAAGDFTGTITVVSSAVPEPSVCCLFPMLVLSSLVLRRRKTGRVNAACT